MLILSLFLFMILHLIHTSYKERKTVEVSAYIHRELSEMERWLCNDFPVVGDISLELRNGLANGYRSINMGSFRERVQRKYLVKP